MNDIYLLSTRQVSPPLSPVHSQNPAPTRNSALEESEPDYLVSARKAAIEARIALNDANRTGCPTSIERAAKVYGRTSENVVQAEYDWRADKQFKERKDAEAARLAQVKTAESRYHSNPMNYSAEVRTAAENLQSGRESYKNMRQWGCSPMDCHREGERIKKAEDDFVSLITKKALGPD